MKKTLNFSKLFKVMIIIPAVILVAGVALLAILGGNTDPAYTMLNLGLAVVLKTILSAVFAAGLVLLYFVIRFRKQGVLMGLCSGLGAAVSALVAFFLCIICRAPLGNTTFATALASVCISYATSVIFFSRFSVRRSRKKNTDNTDNNYSEASSSVFSTMLIMLVIVLAVIICGFAVAAVFSSTFLMLYALPVLLSAVVAVLFTLAVSCRIYANKA